MCETLIAIDTIESARFICFISWAGKTRHLATFRVRVRILAANYLDGLLFAKVFSGISNKVQIAGVACLSSKRKTQESFGQGRGSCPSGFKLLRKQFFARRPAQPPLYVWIRQRQHRDQRLNVSVSLHVGFLVKRIDLPRAKRRQQFVWRFKRTTDIDRNSNRFSKSLWRLFVRSRCVHARLWSAWFKRMQTNGQFGRIAEGFVTLFVTALRVFKIHCLCAHLCNKFREIIGGG